MRQRDHLPGDDAGVAGPGSGVPQVVQRHASRGDPARSTGSSPRAASRRPTANGPFIAIYELDCDDLDAAVRRLGELGRSGKMTGLDNSPWSRQADSPRVYREIGSLRTMTPRRRGPAAHLRVDGADEGRRRPAVQGHRHRRVHVRVLAVARPGGDRRGDGCHAARRRPAGDHLPRAARPDRQRRSAGRDLRRDDGPHRRRQPRQGRHHAHRQTREGRDAVDGDRRRRAAGRRRAGDGRQAQGARPRHGGQLRRRRDQHRLVPRGGEHGRAVGPADGLRLPEQPCTRR